MAETWRGQEFSIAVELDPELSFILILPGARDDLLKGILSRALTLRELTAVSEPELSFTDVPGRQLVWCRVSVRVISAWQGRYRLIAVPWRPS